jgi:hypothetical protein
MIIKMPYNIVQILVFKYFSFQRYVASTIFKIIYNTNIWNQ